MLLSEPLAGLITFFQDEFNKKNYHNSQRMSDSFYDITESSELNKEKKKKKVQKIPIRPCF